LSDFSSDYSKALTSAFEERLVTLGGWVVSKQSYSTGDLDFKGQLTAIRSAKPDLIFIPGYYAEAAQGVWHVVGRNASGMSATEAAPQQVAAPRTSTAGSA